jgi:hypothetical protein
MQFSKLKASADSYKVYSAIVRIKPIIVQR